MLIPVSKNHSINRVIANFFIPQSIIKPDFLFEKIVNSNKLTNYQKRGLAKSKTINLNDKNLNISNDEIRGFIFEEFNKIGKSINVLKVENTSNKAQINFENREYVSWDVFKTRLYSEIKSLSEVYDVFVEAIALTYVDEFIWNSKENINIKEIFDAQSELLNTKFINSHNGTLVLISQSDKLENIQFEEEKTEVMFNNNIKRVIVNHTFAIKFSDIKAYSADNNSAFIENCFEKAHQSNKDLLKKIFTKEIQDLIKLK